MSSKQIDKKKRLKTEPQPPGTLWQAILHLLWQLPTIYRWLFLLIICCFVISLLIWQSFPEKIKNDLVNVLISSSQKETVDKNKDYVPTNSHPNSMIDKATPKEPRLKAKPIPNGEKKRKDTYHTADDNVSLLKNELQRKFLIEKLKYADNYIIAGNTQGKQNAIDLYREVIEALSPKAISILDPKLLKAAQIHFETKKYDNAVEEYRALFKGFY
jgi:hypothetical protein